MLVSTLNSVPNPEESMRAIYPPLVPHRSSTRLLAPSKIISLPAPVLVRVTSEAMMCGVYRFDDTKRLVT